MKRPKANTINHWLRKAWKFWEDIDWPEFPQWLYVVPLIFLVATIVISLIAITRT